MASAAMLRALTACALVACAGGAAPAFAQGGRIIAPIIPQSLRKVYADEGLGAKDALVRVRELLAANNEGEAARVLQQLLEGDADQVLARAEDPWLYVPVRELVHELLLATPSLLERYRAEQEATALEQLTTQGLDGARDVERTRLLTRSGLEAALRVAQDDMESARFDAARLVLSQLDAHPDMQGETALSASRLAGQVLAFVDDARLRELATRWAQRASGEVRVAAARQGAPAGVTPLDVVAGVAWERASSAPLQSIPWANERVARPMLPRNLRGRVPQDDPTSAEQVPWVFPAADATLGDGGGAVYVCDGQSIAAYDAATLAPLWRAVPSERVEGLRARDDAFFAQQGSRTFEDVGGVAVARGVVVGVTGLAINGERRGDPRVHAVDARTGRVLWSVEPARLDERLNEGWVRGTPVIEGTTVVVGVRKPGLFRRVTTLYQVGLDLRTGALRWVRQVGSVGTQPWARFQERVDVPLLAQGVVYRGDEMGVLSATNASTGRPLWVRMTTPDVEQDPNQAQPLGEPGVAFECVAPVKLGTRVFFLEPGGRGEVIALDAATGARVAMRTKRELGEPLYLVGLRAGDKDFVACVGRSRVTFLPADQFANATPVGSEVLSESGLVGRATALATGELAVCVRGGGDATAARLVRLDPRTGAIAGTLDLSRVGNILVAPGDGGSEAGVLLIADAAGLHTHLGWEDAQRRLQARIAQQPQNADPVLTLLELSLRKGEARGAAALADKVLALVDERGGKGDAAQWRERLFDVLRRVLSSSREAMTQKATAQRATPQDDGVPALPPVQDVAVLVELEQRYGRAAESPAQRVDALLEQAFVREVAQQPAASVAALQEVLSDEELSRVAIDPQSAWRLGVVAGAGNAGGALLDDAASVATRQLRHVLRTGGIAAYQTWSDQARRELAAMGERGAGVGGQAHELLRIARQYPLAVSAALAAWRAGEEFTRAGDQDNARSALALAARIVLDCGALGDPEASVAAGEILGALVDHATRSPQPQAVAGPVLRTLREAQQVFAAARVLVGEAQRELGVVVDGSPMTIASAIDKTRRLLESDASAGVGRGAILGTSFGFGVQVIEGYEPLTSIALREAGVSHDSVLMVARGGDRVALFATTLEGQRGLERVWELACDVTPTLVWMDSERTILLWPRVGGASVSCHATQDGRELWKTGALGDLPGMPAPVVAGGDPRMDRAATPLDGVVRADDVVVAVTNDLLVLAERRGRAAAIRTRDGSVAWAKQLPVAAVYDLDVLADDGVGGGVCVVGAAWKEGVEPGKGQGSERQTMPGPGAGTAVVARLAGDDGRTVWSLAGDVLGDHARFVRSLGDGTLVLGTASRVLRVRAGDGAMVWQHEAAGDIANAIAAWGDVSRGGRGLFVMDADYELWRVALEDGTSSTTPLDTHNRVTLPFQGFGTGTGFVLASSMGVAVFDGEGALAGLDALQAQGRLEPAQLGEDVLVTIESVARDPFARFGAEDRQEANLARIVLLSPRDARVVAEQPILLLDAPSSVQLLDGLVVVGQGPYTFVYRTRP